MKPVIGRWYRDEEGVDLYCVAVGKELATLVAPASYAIPVEVPIAGFADRFKDRDEELLLQRLKQRLRLSVDVTAGGIPYEDGNEVRVKVQLLLDDEVLTESESYSTLPEPRGSYS